MAKTTIAGMRLYQQKLMGDALKRPEEVVAWLGAVQAQDYAGAKWALGLRMQPTTDDVIEQAFDEGRILRTHMMRPTWHFVTPDDIRWIMRLTAPRVRVANAHMHRRTELDGDVFARSSDVIARALQGGQYLTRAELAAALADAGIVAEGTRLVYIMMQAELDLVICSGPRRGKQFTYALLDERAPHGRILAYDEALAELTRRYFMGHGPATLRDFAWWSGLTLTDARAGVELAASQLHHEELDDQTYWFYEPEISQSAPPETACLLPTYDEFLVGYSSFDRARRGGQADAQLVFDSTILIGGEVAGTWRRTIRKKQVLIELAPFEALTPAENEAVMKAAERYGAFVGLPVSVQFA